MFPAAAVLALALAGRAAAYTRCAVYPSPEKVYAMEMEFHGMKLMGTPSTHAMAAHAKTGGAPVINVYFHVITANDTAQGGMIPFDAVTAQIATLNADYNATGLSFVLAGAELVANEDWFDNAAPGTPQQDAMKAALRAGGVADLNVYTVSFANTDGLLGYATFPTDYAGAPMDDGIVIAGGSLPGGYLQGFNLGKTLTHEAGHWVGLFHTFMGGCDGVGDMVDDTPAEATAASGCTPGRDTCPAIAGLDPVQNYMDYSDDACLTNFSPGQIARLQDQMSMYRGVEF